VKAIRAPHVACALAALGVLHDRAHRWVPEACRGDVWNITGAVLLSAALVLLALHLCNEWVWLAVALLVGYQAQVAGCSVAYLWEPWEQLPGADHCSDGLALPLAALGVCSIALIAYRGGAGHGHRQAR
jgi:hypothetical protein